MFHCSWLAMLAHMVYCPIHTEMAQKRQSVLHLALSIEQRRMIKEALTLVWGIKRFRHVQYLYSRHYVLKTDQKPLTTIFWQNRAVSSNSSSSPPTICCSSQGTIKYRGTEQHGNADALSDQEALDDRHLENTCLWQQWNGPGDSSWPHLISSDVVHRRG